LAAYEEVRSLLETELGVDPGPELRAAYQATLEQDADAPVVRVRRPLTSVVGRSDELAELRSLLDDHKLVTIVGVGGIGKTRLALEVAASNLTPGGTVAVAELAGVSDATLVAGIVAAAAQIDVGRGEDPEAALLRGLAHRAGLVVIDNCEPVVGA